MSRKTTEFLRGLFERVSDIPPKVPLQSYLAKFYKEAVDAGNLGAQPAGDSDEKLHVPISLFAHAKTGSAHHYAGVHDEEMHFSASLLKVAAMYAAFSLRAEARKLAATPGGFANATAFFTALKQKFNSADAVPKIRNAGPAVGLEPRYADIISVTGFGGGGTLTVEFAPSFYHSASEDHDLFQDYEDVRVAEGLGEDADGNPIENAVSLAAFNKISHMYRMIVPSNNHSAGECIRRLGYAYINVKLMNHGLYNPSSSSPRGIWLAGDFRGGIRVEVDSSNDGEVAVATTSFQMARFFSLIQSRKLIDEDSSKDMKALLKEAHGVDSAWISREGSRLFKFEGVKVGLANLKPNTPPKGPDVFSEGVLLKWKNEAELTHNLNGGIAVCWQNLRRDAIDTAWLAIAEMIEKTFSNFLKQTPI